MMTVVFIQMLIASYAAITFWRTYKRYKEFESGYKKLPKSLIDLLTGEDKAPICARFLEVVMTASFIYFIMSVRWLCRGDYKGLTELDNIVWNIWELLSLYAFNQGTKVVTLMGALFSQVRVLLKTGCECELEDRCKLRNLVKSFNDTIETTTDKMSEVTK